MMVYHSVLLGIATGLAVWRPGPITIGAAVLVAANFLISLALFRTRA